MGHQDAPYNDDSFEEAVIRRDNLKVHSPDNYEDPAFHPPLGCRKGTCPYAADTAGLNCPADSSNIESSIDSSIDSTISYASYGSTPSPDCRTGTCSYYAGTAALNCPAHSSRIDSSVSYSRYGSTASPRVSYRSLIPTRSSLRDPAKSPSAASQLSPKEVRFGEPLEQTSEQNPGKGHFRHCPVCWMFVHTMGEGVSVSLFSATRTRLIEFSKGQRMNKHLEACGVSFNDLVHVGRKEGRLRRSTAQEKAGSEIEKKTKRKIRDDSEEWEADSESKPKLKSKRTKVKGLGTL